MDYYLYFILLISYVIFNLGIIIIYQNSSNPRSRHIPKANGFSGGSGNTAGIGNSEGYSGPKYDSGK